MDPMHIIIPEVPVTINDALAAKITVVALGVTNDIMLQFQNRDGGRDSTIRFSITEENADWLFKGLTNIRQMKKALDSNSN